MLGKSKTLHTHMTVLYLQGKKEESEGSARMFLPFEMILTLVLMPFLLTNIADIAEETHFVRLSTTTSDVEREHGDDDKSDERIFIGNRWKSPWHKPPGEKLD